MAKPKNPSKVIAFPTSFGWIAFSINGKTLARLSFGRHSPRSAIDALGEYGFDVNEPNRFERHLVDRLQAFVDGAPDDFLDLDLEEDHLTPFQQRVIYHCRRIDYGSTASYGELAARAGAPRAARAVGTIMANNRYPLIVPCHRVIASGGKLGGYSAPDGLRMKRRLLELEGAL